MAKSFRDSNKFDRGDDKFERNARRERQARRQAPNSQIPPERFDARRLDLRNFRDELTEA